MARVISNPEHLSNTKKYISLEVAKSFSLLADKMGQKEPPEVAQKISESIVSVAKPVSEPILEVVTPQTKRPISEDFEVVPDSPEREEEVTVEIPERGEEADSNTPEVDSSTPDAEIGGSIENDDSISASPEPRNESPVQKTITQHLRRSWRFINQFGSDGRVDYTRFFYVRPRK